MIFTKRIKRSIISRGLFASIIIPSGIILLAAACGSKGNLAEDPKPVVAVSYDAHKYILQQIAGDDFDVRVLLPSGSDPEMYEPDIRTMEGLQGAGIYFSTSTLGFEKKMERMLQKNFPDMEIDDISKGIEPITTTHSSEGEDPHYLSSIRNIRIIAANILSGLKRINPEDSTVYNSNFSLFSQKIDKMENRIDSLLSGAPGGAFVAVHPMLSYLARDYGLQQISLETDGKEVTPRQLKERLIKGSLSGARVLFYEKGYSSGSAEALGKSLGIPSIPVYFEGEDFMDQILKSVEAYANGRERNK